MRRILKGSATRHGTKITLKLFAVTASVYTALLVCALAVQSRFYEREYYVLKQRKTAYHYFEVCNALKASAMDAESVSRIHQLYKDNLDIDTLIFLSDGITEKFSLDSLKSAGYRYGKLLEEAIPVYKASIAPSFDRPNNYYDGGRFVSADGIEYSIFAANVLEGDEIVIGVTLYEDYGTPGLVDKYFIYISIAGIVVSIAISLAFSIATARPLIRANTVLESDICRERALEATRKEFVTNVSHELKTPLTIVGGYAEALRDNIRADKRAHYIDQIIRQTEEMGKLVEDMLDLSRIENGTYKPQIERFDLAALALGILESLRILLDEKDIKAFCSLNTGMAVISADRLKMSQVVTNLMHNAIRHTPAKGGIYISINRYGGETRFEIENEGAAIDSEKLDKVWDRFYRADGDRSKKTGGTGLGLAISARILQMHGIPYGVRNTERGVLFYFVPEVAQGVLP